MIDMGYKEIEKNSRTWVKAVNEHGGFGNLKQAVSRDPSDVKMIIEGSL